MDAPGNEPPSINIVAQLSALHVSTSLKYDTNDSVERVADDIITLKSVRLTAILPGSV